MGELLLELFSEEIPARMQAKAAEDLKRLVTDALKAEGLEFATARAFSTPRRLTLVVKGIPATQPDRSEEKKGPRVGSPQPAIDGFLKSAGLTSLDQCEQRDTGKGVFYFAITEKRGGKAIDVILNAVRHIKMDFPWPKSMRHGDDTFVWVRPLQNILFKFDGETPHYSLSRNAPSQSSNDIWLTNKTEGHRFMAPGEFEVSNFVDYEDKLRGHNVILDPAARRSKIERDCEVKAAELGLKVRPDDALLDEVTGLVEWPVALVGSIDRDFMTLPPEVLTTTMRQNQKYFALTDASGALAPKFIVVANIETKDKGAAIIAGNERVLRARLSDAQFFWTQDLKVSLAERSLALKDIVFHAKLGTVAEKVARVRALAERLSQSIPGCNAAEVALASDLAKADLVTGMVGEFPELQGIMGRYYALAEGLPGSVADAIADHYRPLGPSDECPRAPVSVAVALADKIDTLTGFFAIDEKPTGSKDPFSLRRAALGAIRLILENNLSLQLRPIIEAAFDAYVRGAGIRGESAAIIDALLEFLADRLKVALREQGTRHDLVAAVFAKDLDDLGLIVARARALQDFVGTESGLNLLTAYRRANNIVRIETTKDRKEAKSQSISYDGEVSEALLVERDEQSLAKGLDEAGTWFKRHPIDGDLTGAMKTLSALRGPVDDFFDKVTVNCGDPALRANRLRLLSKIARTIDNVADFARIEG